MAAFHRNNKFIAILSIITFFAIAVQSKTGNKLNNNILIRIVTKSFNKMVLIVKGGRAEVDPVNVYFQLLTRFVEY